MIGGPLCDLQVYILDEYQELAPIGVPGELYVGGAGFEQRIYLQRPELTAESVFPTRIIQSGSGQILDSIAPAMWGDTRQLRHRVSGAVRIGR